MKIGLGPILADRVIEDDLTFKNEGHFKGAREEGAEPFSDAYSRVWGSFEQVHSLINRD